MPRGVTPISLFRTWIVLEAEPWNNTAGSAIFPLSKPLEQITLAALSEMEGGGTGGRLWRQGARVELALPEDIPPREIAVQFVEALRGAVRTYDADCEPGDALRLRMALAAQEASRAGTGESRELSVARDLVVAPVITRVLAADGGHPLALIASAQWYEAFILTGHASADSYKQVQVTTGSYRGSAWVSVPGQSQPHGVTLADQPQGGQAAEADRASVRNIVEGGSHGVVIQSGVINGGVYIANRYADGRRAGEDA